MTLAAVPSTITIDLVRAVAFLLGFLLMGGLARLSWNAYRTRAETDANSRVLTGVATFSFGTAVLVFTSLSHVTDQVHRQNVSWISPVLITAEVVMFAGLAAVLSGQGKRVRDGEVGPARMTRKPLAAEDHPLDEMASEAQERNGKS